MKEGTWCQWKDQTEEFQFKIILQTFKTEPLSPRGFKKKTPAVACSNHMPVCLPVCLQVDESEREESLFLSLIKTGWIETAHNSEGVKCNFLTGQ